MPAKKSKLPNKEIKRRTRALEVECEKRVNMRFFFTAADEEMAKFIYDRCEELGLFPYEYIRTIVYKFMREGK